MKKLIYLFVIITITSCNNKSGVKDGTANNADSSITTKFVFNEAEFKQLDLPLTIDSAFIHNVDTNSRITYQKIRELGVNFLEGDLGNILVYEFNDFCNIDSLKQVGKYSDYLSKLDINMTKASIAYKVGCVKLNENSRLFIWGISNSSYEACPVFGGTKLIGTYVAVGKPATLFTIAEESFWSDAPNRSQNLICSTVNKNETIDIKSITISADDDAKNHLTQTITNLKVENNTLVIANTKKEEKSTEKVSQ